MLGHRESRRVYKYKYLRYWAENGMVTLIDELRGDTRRIKVKDFLDRANALALEIARDTPEDRITKTRVVEEMLRCAEEAVNQGDPTDPKVQEHHRRHQAHKKVSLIVPDLGNLAVPRQDKLIL